MKKVVAGGKRAKISPSSQAKGTKSTTFHMCEDFCLIDLILYVPVNNFSVMSGWVEPVLSKDKSPLNANNFHYPCAFCAYWVLWLCYLAVTNMMFWQ